MAAVTAYSAPEDGCKGHLKHVEYTCSFNPFSARGPIYRPPLCLRRMREADVSANLFQALQ